MKLTEKAITVHLQISQWAARKYDKSVSDEVEKAHNAKDAGRFNKSLIAKDKLEPITKVVSKARNFHLKNTQPWDDNGTRLLPSTNYFQYMSEVNKLKTEFDKAVAEFVRVYDLAVEDAKIRLGSMFSEKDYPTQAQIEHKFGIKVITLPVPEIDFRVDLNDEEIQNLKSSMEIEMTERLNAAVKDNWKRIKEQLTHMRDILSKKESRVHDSLFDNLGELVEVLPRLNLTDDPNLTAICEDIKSTLVVDGEAVRSSPALKNQKARDVDDIMKKFSGFF